jgi:hypothetical protein
MKRQRVRSPEYRMRRAARRAAKKAIQAEHQRQVALADHTAEMQARANGAQL